VIGAVIELGLCLDLTSSSGVDAVREAFDLLKEAIENLGGYLPANSIDTRRRLLDRAVIEWPHTVRADRQLSPIDTVKGVFTEGGPLYPGSGFVERTHIQIAVRNPACIKGVFRVPPSEYEP